MEIESKTPAFYGELVEVAMSKDVMRMTEMLKTLNAKQEMLLGFALLDIASLLVTIKKIEGCPQWR
jgi:hypothetical protein